MMLVKTFAMLTDIKAEALEEVRAFRRIPGIECSDPEWLDKYFAWQIKAEGPKEAFALVMPEIREINFRYQHGGGAS